jgi:RimJ/RimL family protein N-acetyltransferase
MSQAQRWSVSWNAADGRLDVHEPSAPEVQSAAARLAGWYNDQHNRAMMANTCELDEAEVCEHFARVWQEGGRNFLLYAEGVLMGDADLRHVDLVARTAEFAILIGERNAQGRGFGTRFALMVHALAFTALALERIYVSIIPANRGSLRLFEKLGYRPDDSEAARVYIDEVEDVTMSFARDDFMRRHGDAVHELTMSPRFAVDSSSPAGR